MKIKAYACVGTHGKPFYCSISNNQKIQGRFEIYENFRDALNNALNENFVREVEIEILPIKKKD